MFQQGGVEIAAHFFAEACRSIQPDFGEELADTFVPNAAHPGDKVGLLVCRRFGAAWRPARFQDRFDRPFCLVECVGIVKPQPDVVDIDWIQAKIDLF